VPDIDNGYAVFFEDEYRSVLRTAFLIVRDQQRAEDVAQDAFVQLYQHWRKVSRYERPEAWVRRVAIRLAVREVKRTRVREVLQLKSPSPLPVEPLDLDVLDAVKQLSPMQARTTQHTSGAVRVWRRVPGRGVPAALLLELPPCRQEVG
jgi:RNA polymerase sigma-70 factor (ECF subfamily)